MSNPSPKLAFMLWLRLQDASTGKPVRPAFYDDNFLSLLPGESRTVNIEYSGKIDPAKTRLVVDGRNIARSQYQDGRFTDLPDVRSTKPVRWRPFNCSISKTFPTLNNLALKVPERVRNERHGS